MNSMIRSWFMLGALLAAGASGQAQSSTIGPSREAALAFVENAGQWNTPAMFVARRGALSVRAERYGLWLQQETRSAEDPRGHLIHLGFDGASAGVQVLGEGLLAGTRSFFLGSRAEGNWRTAVPSYGAVEYAGLYEGVDLFVSASRAGVELLLRAEDEAALARVRLGFVGAEQVEILEAGRVVLSSPLGQVGVRLVAEVGANRGVATWIEQVGDSGARYRVSWLAESGSNAGSAPGGGSLPDGLEWSTFLGGVKGDRILDVVVADDGVITVCGQTGSASFPTTPGPFTQYGGWDYDAFVTRIDPAGPELVYSALMGGVLDDRALALDWGTNGSVFVCGVTGSENFPSSPFAYQTDLMGSQDAFVLHLDRSGTQLFYSTLLGGQSGSVTPSGITVDLAGRATIVGGVGGIGTLPTTPGAFDTTLKSGFVTRFNSTGSDLVYSTYIGGPLGGAHSGESLHEIESFEDGRVVFCGSSKSYSYPTTPGAYSQVNTSLPGVNTEEIVVTILSADGAFLEASTYIGGDLNDRATSVAIGPGGDIFLAGKVGAGFTTTSGAYQENAVAGNDAVVIRLTPALDELVYATRVGANQFDTETGSGITVDASGIATVVGTTNAVDFPTTPGALSEVNPGVEASEENFVVRVAPTGDRLFYSTYLGGNDLELYAQAAFDSHGSVVVTGLTDSLDFPLTPDALFGPPNGGINDTSDGYIARLSLLPTGVRKLGTSAESCRGPIFMGVTRMAVEGDADFGVTCSGAPPSAAAALSLGFGEFPGGGLVLPEFTYYLDVFKPIVVFLDGSDSDGYAEFDLPLPTGTAGLEFLMQYIWINTDDCGGLGTLSASNALGITVQ